jgi:hypothetical protein
MMDADPVGREEANVREVDSHLEQWMSGFLNLP